MQNLELWHGESTNDQLTAEDFDDRLVASSSAALTGKREQLIELASKCSCVILKFTSRFCLIDVFGDSARSDDEKRQDVRKDVRSRCCVLFVQHWPKLVFLINFYCIIKITINIWLQYEYDHCILKLKWILKHFDGQPEMRANHMSDPSVALDTIDQLRLECNTTRATLKSIGAPHLGATIAIECVYITILMMVGSSYILGLIYFRFVQNYDFHLVRAILNRKRELHNCRRLIIREVNKFIVSRRNFMLFDITCTSTRMTSASASKSAHLMEVHKLWLNQQLLVRQLKLMAKRGALTPINWTTKWLDLMSLIYCLFSCSFIAWAIFFDFAFYQLMPKYANFIIESEPLDLVFDFDLLLISVITSTALIFYLSTCVLSCLDQARLIARVHQLVLACVHENWQIHFESTGSSEPVDDFRLQELQSVGGLSMQDTIEQQHRQAQMNENLLRAIVHYKVFVVQLQPILRGVAFVSFVSIVIILSHPVMIRLHTPYLESLELKSRYYIISLIAAFFVNLNILPVCYINSRCVNLYNALHSLLAHTIQLSEIGGGDYQETGSEMGTNIYDAHSIWTLRRELKSAALFVRKFETRAFGLTFTYANIMRVYFWLGAISLSILATDPQDYPPTGNAGLDYRPTIFHDFLRDPFGFYTWP